MDPVQCLKLFIQRTASVRPLDTLPVFVSLKAPYKAIASDTIGSILQEAIHLAGLDGQGFTAKSFRPTGATTAVTLGIIPETVMKVGRWKTKEVFLNHYVYARMPRSYTTDMLEGAADSYTLPISDRGQRCFQVTCVHVTVIVLVSSIVTVVLVIFCCLLSWERISPWTVLCSYNI
jgi:hypothetical protein